MKYLIYIMIGIVFISCNNERGYEVDHNYLSCDQLLNTSGLKLYSFKPFTDSEWRSTSYEYKLGKRQIPQSFLNKMNTTALFYQFVLCDLSKSIGLFNSIQLGFENAKEQLNMLPELLNRQDAGETLLKILQQISLETIDNNDCMWFYRCLQIVIAQPEVINQMAVEDIEKYILFQMRSQEIISGLAETNPYYWIYPNSLDYILFGLGNVMLRYEFEPFVKMLETNPGLNDFMITATIYGNHDEYVSLINDCIEKFKNN